MIEIGKWYTFTKSGRRVKVVEKVEARYEDKRGYIVERADGSQFFALESSLVEPEYHKEQE